jgi:hypothetical protein
MMKQEVDGDKISCEWHAWVFPSYQRCNQFGINMALDLKICIIEVFKKRLLHRQTSLVLHLRSMENKLQNIHHEEIILHHRIAFITDLEKDVGKPSFKELRSSPLKIIFQKSIKGYNGLKESQAKQTKYFVFNEKDFILMYLDVL